MSDLPLTGWPQVLLDELAANRSNGRVGQRLLSETDRVRIWHIELAPGQRLPFHRHVLDYFWTAVTAGRGRSHRGDGSVVETAYAVGDTRHLAFPAGEAMIHDLENIGESPLVFVTVEFVQSANAPLPLD